jgi:hypothetical protein
MKKSYNKLCVAILAAFALVISSSSTVNAGWFSASFSTEPSVTLFGQTLTVPIPSVILGAEAGTSVSGNISSGGARVALPFIKVGVRSPKLTVGVKGAKISVSTSGVKKASAPKKKARKAKK